MSGSTYGPITQSGTVTQYLPLTTSWPTSQGCSSLFVQPVASTGNTFYLFDPGYASDVGGGPLCMPPEASSWWYQSTMNSQQPTTTLLGGYAMSCPQAYTTVYSVPSAGTTTIGCCPTSYSYQSFGSSTLADRATPVQCYSIYPAGIATFIQPNSNGDFTTTTSTISEPTTVFAVQVNGFIFQSPTGTSSISGSAPTRTTTIASVVTSTVAATLVPSGLSSGAKAGVGIAVAFGVIGLASFLAAAILLRRRRQTVAKLPRNQVHQDHGDAHEMTGKPIYEMSAPQQTAQEKQAFISPVSEEQAPRK